MARNWHGGAYTYILGSGILQFVIMFLEDILEPINAKVTDKLGIRRDVFSYKLYQVFRTYILFSFTMIFFRATSVSEALHILKNMLFFNPGELMNISLLVELRSELLDYVLLFISIGIMFIVELLARKINVREKLFEQNILFRWILIFGLIFFVIVFGCYGVGYNPTNFIYGGF